MSSDTKKSAIRFNIVSLATPFQSKGLGDLVLSTRFTKDQGIVYQIAAAMGLNAETVPDGVKLVDGPGASIEPCTGHWHINDNFDGSETGRVGFAISGQDGWALQIERLSPLAQSRLEFIDGAEEVSDGLAVDDLIDRGASALREEILREMLFNNAEMGVNGSGRNGSDGFEDYLNRVAEELQAAGIDVTILGL